MMSLPGLLCLYLFFIVPLVTLLKIALSVRVPTGGYPGRVQLGVGQLLARRSPTSAASCGGRSPTPAIATILCVLIAYPIAYFIAFKAGQVARTSCSGW